MGLLDAPLESTLPDLHERAPGVVGPQVLVVVVRGILERARLALDDINQFFQLLEADRALASSTNGEGASLTDASPVDAEGAFLTERRGRREDERAEERARHCWFFIRAAQGAGSAVRRLALTAARGRVRECTAARSLVSGHAALYGRLRTDFAAAKITASGL